MTAETAPRPGSFEETGRRSRPPGGRADTAPRPDRVRPFRKERVLLDVVATGLSAKLAREAALERERALEALRRDHERLVEVDAMKQAFTSMVSHELRTPLTSIIGYLDLLREGKGGELTGRQGQWLEVIGRNATRLHKLVDDTLTVGRADSGRLDVAHERVEIALVVAQAVESATPVADEKGLALEADTEDGLPEVRGDRRLIAQLLDNLMSNALKFTPEGGSVRLRARREGEVVAVEVRDTGPGIPEDELPKLFERFFRASTASEVPGTGLGLYSKAIAEATADRSRRERARCGQHLQVHAAHHGSRLADAEPGVRIRA